MSEQRPQVHVNAITTGQGGDWKGARQNGRPLGNNRAPIPTCGIPISTGGRPAVEVIEQQPSSAKAADCQEIEMHSSGVQLIFPYGTRSSSMESTQQHVSPAAASDQGSLLLSEESDLSDDEEDLCMEAGLRRSGRTLRHKGNSKGGKEKKKVGRPIAYRGDPNAPELTELERRRIKRRIANRESARRVRHKRQEVLEDLQIKMEHMQQHNAELKANGDKMKAQRDSLGLQLRDMEGKYSHLSHTKDQMQLEIDALRSSLQMKMTALETELDKRDNEGEIFERQSAFGSAEVQSQACFQSMEMPLPFSGPDIDMKHSSSLKQSLEFFPSLNLDDPHSVEMLSGLLGDNFRATMAHLKEEPTH